MSAHGEHRQKAWWPGGQLAGVSAALLSGSCPFVVAAAPDSAGVPGSPSAVVWPALVVAGFSLLSLLAWVVMRLAGMPARGEDVVAQAQDPHDTTLLPLAVTSAIGIVEKRYAEPLTTAAIAAEVHVRPEDLERLFRESTGKSVAEYLDTHRMERAVELIKTTSFEISEIRLRVGIHDPDAFAELFRAATGMTAADYVQECRGMRRSW